MESLTNRMRNSGHSLESYPNNRLEKRTVITRHNLGEDLGSTQFTYSKAKKMADTRRSDDSDDELDCLSQTSQSPTRGNQWQDIVKGPKSQPTSSRKFVDEHGREHAYNPNFLPEKDAKIKSLRFTKNKNKSTESPKENNFTSVVDKSQTTSRPPKPNTPGSSCPGSSLSEVKKPRPRPRPTHNPKPSRAPTPPRKVQAFPEISPLKTHNHSRTHGSSTDDNSSKQSKPSKSGPSKASDFLPSPLNTPVKDLKKEKPKRTPVPFPMGSPLARPRDPASTFVLPSPLSTPQKAEEQPGLRRQKGKAKDVEMMELSSGSEDERGRRHPQPFPMNTQMFEDIDSSPVRTPKARNSKRLSDESLDRGRKKHKGSGDSSFDFSFSEDPDTTISLNPNIDPSTLCPYCDHPLPSNPSPLLQKLLITAEKVSKSDPRPTNPLGRKAPFIKFISVCQRHRFEDKILPEAEKKGWPKTIQWEGIEGRIKRMRKDLRALIDDRTDGLTSDFEDGDDSIFWNDSPKSRCVFWKEIMKEVKKKGSKVVAGVQNQLTNFDKTQPGYYGELGSVIMLQTLYNLFPPTSFDPTSVAPLSPAEFISQILVPEVALRLIMEDMDLTGPAGAREALQILRESTQYGVSMFPEDEGEWGVADVDSGHSKVVGGIRLGLADQMALDRARKRRKELEAEEAEERDSESIHSDVSESAQHRGRHKGKGKASTLPPKRQPRPRPTGPSPSADEIEITPSASLPSFSRSPSRESSPTFSDDMIRPSQSSGAAFRSRKQPRQRSQSRSSDSSSDIVIIESDKGDETPRPATKSTACPLDMARQRLKAKAAGVSKYDDEGNRWLLSSESSQSQ